MRVLAHLDPTVLERELLSQVSRAGRAREPHRILVVVPTTRLADHVQRRLTQASAAWLGVEVLHFRALAQRIVEQHGERGTRVASPRVLEALLERVLRDLPDNEWSRFVERRPGAAGRLMRSLNELREAGIAPPSLDACCADHAGMQWLTEIYRSYGERLQRAEKDCWTDEAGLVFQAVAHACRFASRFDSVFVHGVYELTGVHLQLVRALDDGGRVTVLLPSDAKAPVASYSREFAAQFLLTESSGLEPVEEVASDTDRIRLAALYDEPSHPPAAAEDRFGFRHCQGEAAEVAIAMREALGAVRQGCPPAEIALVARTLERYVPAIEEVCGDERLPVTCSASSPLRRHPAVHDLLLLLEVLAEDFPRRATAELLRSPRLRWRELIDTDRLPRGDRADVWSRKARIIGGLEEWTQALPRWAGRPSFYRGQGPDERADAERRANERAVVAADIGQGLLRLQEIVEPGPRSWGEHGRRLAGLLPSLFEEPENPETIVAFDALRDLLDEMTQLETVVGDRRPIPFERMRSWLENAVDDSELAAFDRDNGGIRVLDAMQVRGLTFRRVHLLGLNTGVFPRVPREDPVLPEAIRLALIRRTGMPLPVKSRGTAEERLLLSILLGSAEERIDLSWQRADEAGRARTPSLILREIARVAQGKPDPRALRSVARHLPSHPTQWLDELVSRPGLLSPTEEPLLIALGSASGEAPENLQRRFPALAPGLAMLRATQAFHPVDASYDARVGEHADDRDLSVSALEMLGRCPLQYFFSRVLRVPELEEQASPLEINPRDVGTEIHALLETIYAILRDEGLFGGADARSLVTRGLELLDERGGRVLGEMSDRIRDRLPVLHEQWTRSWLEATREFLKIDLTRVGEQRFSPASLEDGQSHRLDFGKGLVETVRARFDRRLEGPGGTLVGDYKTSGNLERRIKVTEMLKGATLQVPLYRMIAGDDARVELLGVGPQFAGDPDGHRWEFDGFDSPELGESFLETIRVLLRLRRAGSFPLHNDHHCSWCPYDRACRRHHPPTIDREQRAEDGLDYRRTQKKSTRKPTLADLRGVD